MPVTVQQEQIDDCHVALTIQVPPEDVQKAIESVFNQYARRTAVPGFRPGKAPRHLIKRFIDEERVREMALDQSLNRAYRDALKQANVDPYPHAEPQVELPEEELKPEEGFSFKATVALQPKVELGSLDGLSVRRVVVKITDEDVDRELDNWRERVATFQKTDEPAQDGDRIRAAVHVTVDGKVIPEMHLHDPTLMQVGANLEGFDEGIRGLKAGEEKTFEFTYPEDSESEELAGKTAVAGVHCVDVLRRTVPDADDEFAKKVGFDTLDALKARLKEMLQAQADVVADQEVNTDLISEVVGRATVHFPDEMLDREVSERMAELIRDLQKRGAQLEDYLAHRKIELSELQAELREQSRRTVTNTLVLLDLARDQGITVTEKDVEAEIKARAEVEGVKPSTLRRSLNDSGEMADLEHRIFLRKIAALLREKAEIKEVEA